MTVPIMAEPIGTTRALQEVSIRARVRGFLKEIHFEEGGDVKEGQLLFVIDEEPFKAKLAEAQARLDAGRGQPEEGAGLQGAGGRRGPARARPGDARTRRGRGAARAVAAVKRNAASRRGRPAQAGASARRTRPRSRPTRPAWSRPRPTTRRTSSPPRPTSTAAKARVTDAEIDLSYCRMSSPIDGRIGLAEVKLGNLVGPATGGRRRRLHRAGGRPAARPDGRRHPGRLPLPRPGDAADRPGAPRRGLPARPRGGGGPPRSRARRRSSTTRSTRRPPPS